MADSPAPARPRRRKLHQRIFDWLFTHVFPALFAAFLKTLFATQRWEIRGREHLRPFWDDGSPVIVGCWHGRLLMIPRAWQRVGRGDVHVLMGRNRNGELITRIVSRFNMGAIRGGSSAGGEEARSRMMDVVRQSPRSTLAMTPDGPRGPRYESKMGMAHLSRTLQIPVVWVAASARRSLRIPTWDRFLLPLPFSRVVVDFSAPLHPDAHAGLDLDAWRRELDRFGRRHLLRLDEELGVVLPEDRELLGA